MFQNISSFILRGFAVASFILLFQTEKTKGQEFMVIDDTIEYDMDSPHGFHWYYQDYISTLPSNWSSPYNYKTGQFYTRYEVISEASDEPCGLQFGIWQYRNVTPGPDEKNYSEVMADIIELNGPGSIEYDNSSPVSWWKTYEGVSFSRVYDFWRLGINIWSLPPEKTVIAPVGYGGKYIEDVWNERSKWFPIKIKVQVIAVASGYTFSGWENYVTDPVKPPTPDYEINFSNETTGTAVPSTDEYSVNSNMSGAVSGTGSVISVTPGQDLYFRTKAEGINPASDIQHLDVPNRPAAPDININYGSEETVETISSAIEYSFNSDMSGAVIGTGTKVAVTPGQDIYFRYKATASQFKSNISTLDVPERPDAPDFTIGYENEQTNETVSSLIYYSTNADMSGSVAGSDNNVDLTPGTDMYFQTAAAYLTFRSDIQHLEVDDRPVIPSIGIDFENALTDVAIPSSLFYSENADMSSALAGADDYLTVEAGNTYFFQQLATGSTFASDINEVVVPGTPELSSESPAVTSESPIVVQIQFDHSATNFDVADISVTNGIANNLRESFIVDIHPIVNDSIIVEVPHNIVDEGNFKSNRLVFYYQGSPNAAKTISWSENIHVFPNPSTGIFTVTSEIVKIKSVEIINMLGQVELTESVHVTEGMVNINADHLNPGYYYLKIKGENDSYRYPIVIR